MAVISSHTLNGTDGTHAGGIAVTLTNLNTRKILFTDFMDDAGRLSQHISADSIDPKATYELVFNTSTYWAVRKVPVTVFQIALRFAMEDPTGNYHMPLILNPNSYSMWSSA